MSIITYTNNDKLNILNNFLKANRSCRDLMLFYENPKGRNGIHFLDWFVLWERFQCEGKNKRDFFKFIENWENTLTTGDYKTFNIYPSYMRLYHIRNKNRSHLSVLRDFFSLYEKLPFHFPPCNMVEILQIVQSLKPELKTVFDPCAGWGGRLLGCSYMNIDYIGVDTNSNLIEPYKYMIETIQYVKKNNCSYTFINDDCMTIDLEQFRTKGLLQCIITSPPYFNLEKYRTMTIRSRQEWVEWYKRFFLRYYEALDKNGLLILNVNQEIFQIFKTIKEPTFFKEFKITPRKTTNYKEYFYVWIK